MTTYYHCECGYRLGIRTAFENVWCFDPKTDDGWLFRDNRITNEDASCPGCGKNIVPFDLVPEQIWLLQQEIKREKEKVVALLAACKMGAALEIDPSILEEAAHALE